jgi:hypothetical protein
MKSIELNPVIVSCHEPAQLLPSQFTCVCSNGLRMKIAALPGLALLTIMLFHGAAMATSSDRIQFICNTDGISQPAAFCNAVATSLEEALGTPVAVVKKGEASDSALAARLDFSVTGRSGKAVIEIGKVQSGNFIPASTETTGVQTMDTSVERGSAKLIANILASRLRN